MAAQGFSLRPARADDYAAYVTFYDSLRLPRPPLHEEQWLADVAPHSYVLVGYTDKDAEMCTDNRTDECTDRVGYVFVEVLGSVAYLRIVAVKEGYRGKGIGKILMAFMSNELRTRGCKEWRLNCFIDNVPALRLYKGIGMTIAYPTTVFELEWATIESTYSGELRRTHGKGSSVLPEDDNIIETQFSLPLGQINRLRSLKGSILLKLLTFQTRENDTQEEGEEKDGKERGEEDGKKGGEKDVRKGSIGDTEVEVSISSIDDETRQVGQSGYETEEKVTLSGFLCYQPTYNVCNPFKVIDVVNALDILMSLRGLFQLENSNVSLFVEDNEKLGDEFVKLGAKTTMETYHLRGLIH